MVEHVSANQTIMFREATTNVRNNINTMCEQVRASVRGRVKPIYHAIARDYMTIVQVGDCRVKTMGAAEKLLRRKVDNALAQADVAFKDVLEDDYDGLEEEGMADAAIATEADVDFGDDAEDASVPLVVLSSDDARGEGDSEDDEF